jgi:hypothetical protein
MSACIIPVAPNFQDPPSATDAGPYFAGYSPVDGRLVTFTPPVSTFSVLVTDPNVNAPLWFRWVWDYPPVNNSSSMIFPPAYQMTSAGPDGVPITKNICCSVVNNANGLHQVELIVADEPFQDSSMAGLTDDNRFDTLEFPGHVQKATWTIAMSCMAGAASGTCSP